MNNLGLKVIQLLAIGLGKDRNYFNEWFEKDSLSSMRSIHYLPRPANSLSKGILSEDQVKLVNYAHSDSGFLTFLTTFGYPGLQVKVGDTFMNPKIVKNAIVVNLGDLF